MPHDLSADITIPAITRENTTAASSRKHVRRVLPVVLLLVFSALIAVDRVALSEVPINVDPAFYAVVSHELILGKSLYTDVWDHKPPAIFVIYAAAESVFGYSASTLTILNILFSLVILIGVFYAGGAGPGGVVSGMVAAGLWVVISGNVQLETRDPNTEPFINACMIWAFALLAKDRKISFRTSVLIGLLFLFGSLLKPVVVAIAIALTAVHFLVSKDRKMALRNAAVIGGVGFVGWLGVFGYFALTDRFEAFYGAVISYNGDYPGNIWANMTAPLMGGGEFFLDALNPLALFAVFGLILTLFKDRRRGALLAAYIAASWIAIALPGRFSVHYFQLWLLPLIVGSTWAICYFSVSKDFRLKVASLVAGAVLLMVIVFNEAADYRTVVARRWLPALPALNAGDAAAAKINSLLAENETFFLWGNTPNLYLLAGRRPPAAVLFDSHLRKNPVSDQLSERVREDLARERPELLVAEIGRPPVPEFIARDYEPVPLNDVGGVYSIYVRRGGRLANLHNHQ